MSAEAARPPAPTRASVRCNAAQAEAGARIPDPGLAYASTCHPSF
jgi:hypothetical protein